MFQSMNCEWATGVGQRAKNGIMTIIDQFWNSHARAKIEQLNLFIFNTHFLIKEALRAQTYELFNRE